MKSVRNAVLIMEELAIAAPLGVGDLARRTGIAKSTAQRCLQTLRDAGWIEVADASEPGATTTWVLSARFAQLSLSAPIDLAEIAMPHLLGLRDAVGESVHLVELDGQDIVLRQRVPGPGPVQIVLPLGSRMPAYATATGKAILAQLPRDKIAPHLPQRLRRLTDLTVASRNELFSALDQIVEQRWATNLGEWNRGVVAVAAPVVRAGRPVAALSVSTTPEGLARHSLKELAALVLAAADGLAADPLLGHC